jgi:hypothetical protein
MRKSPVHLAAEALARRLEALGVPYAIAGALAVNAHGLVRATEDVDVLIARAGLRRFKEAWLGRGYEDVSTGSNAVRDSERGVKVSFLITGQYPGDGKPQPVAFPEPEAASVPGPGFPVLSLERLLELKIASGMTAVHRIQDLDDVLRLIRINRLPRAHGEKLDPYVREKFDELWLAAQHPEEDY